MPGIAHLHTHRTTDEKKQSHTRSHCQRTLGIDRHQEGTHCTYQCSGRKQSCRWKGVGRPAHSFKSLWGQGEDISHDNKSTYPGKHLGSQRMLATIESEYLGYLSHISLFLFHASGFWGSCSSWGVKAARLGMAKCRTSPVIKATVMDVSLVLPT